MVAFPYVMRRFSREANRRVQERSWLRMQAQRAAQGLPPLQEQPQSLDDFMYRLQHG